MEKPTLDDLQTEILSCIYNNVTLDIVWGTIEATILSYVVATTEELQDESKYVVFEQGRPDFDLLNDKLVSVPVQDKLSGSKWYLSDRSELASLCETVGETLVRAVNESDSKIIAGTIKLKLSSADLTWPWLASPILMYVARKNM